MTTDTKTASFREIFTFEDFTVLQTAVHKAHHSRNPKYWAILEEVSEEFDEKLAILIEQKQIQGLLKPTTGTEGHKLKIADL